MLEHRLRQVAHPAGQVHPDRFRAADELAPEPDGGVARHHYQVVDHQLALADRGDALEIEAVEGQAASPQRHPC